jgi:hypothetical protein
MLPTMNRDNEMTLNKEQLKVANSVKRALTKARDTGLSVRGYDGALYLLNIEDFYGCYVTTNVGVKIKLK